jgi:hypothetical protein
MSLGLRELSHRAGRVSVRPVASDTTFSGGMFLGREPSDDVLFLDVYFLLSDGDADDGNNVAEKMYPLWRMGTQLMLSRCVTVGKHAQPYFRTFRYSGHA